MKSREVWQLLGQVGGAETEIVGVCESSAPRPNHLAFIRTEGIDAVAIVEDHRDTTFLVPRSKDNWPGNCLAVANPRLAFAVIAREVVGGRAVPGIASTAVVHPSAKIHESASIGHFTFIESEVQVGSGTIIGSHVRLHAGVSIGSDCAISNHTSIGSSGFGFEVGGDGRPIRLAHVGGVKVGDRVEIGTHVAIAQGTIQPTLIGSDVKIDDAVFIAHNVQVGEATYVIAGASVCGSVQIGHGAWISPESTIINKAVIGDGALVGLGAVVVSDVAPGVVVAGVPAKVRGDRVG